MPEKKDEKKADKPKTVQEKEKSEARAGAQQKQIQIQLPTLTLDFGPHFQMKLIILGLLAVIFSFAMLVFTRTNFATIDLVDFARLEFNIPKLWGIWFIIFVLFYSLSLALAVHYGFGTPKLQALLALVVLSLVSAVAGVLSPPFSLAFYGFALALGVAAIEASFAKELTASSIWGATSRALLALLILAFVFAFFRFSAGRDLYFNHLLASATSSSPDLIASAAPALGTQALNLCSDVITAIPITEETIRGALSRQAIANAVESSGGPLYTALPSSTKQQILDSLYDETVVQTLNLTNNLKSEVGRQVKKIDVGKQLKAANLTQFLSPSQIKGELEKIPATKQLLEAFPLLAAFSVVSLVSILNFFLHILATIFAWGLNKIV